MAKTMDAMDDFGKIIDDARSAASYAAGVHKLSFLMSTWRIKVSPSGAITHDIDCLGTCGWAA